MTAPPAAPTGPKTTAPIPAPMPAPSTLPASAVRGRADKDTRIIPVLRAECMTHLFFEWGSDGTTHCNQICSRREVDCFEATVKIVPINHAHAKRRCRRRFVAVHESDWHSFTLWRVGGPCQVESDIGPWLRQTRRAGRVPLPEGTRVGVAGRSSVRTIPFMSCCSVSIIRAPCCSTLCS